MALIVRMPDNPAMSTTSDPPELRKLALQALLEPNSAKKVAFTQWIRAQAATILIASETVYQEPHGVPGCPPKPELRSHLDVPKRSPFTTEGLAALLHAVTHIEFNAIKIVKNQCLLNLTPCLPHSATSGSAPKSRSSEIPCADRLHKLRHMLNDRD